MNLQTFSIYTLIAWAVIRWGLIPLCRSQVGSRDLPAAYQASGWLTAFSLVSGLACLLLLVQVGTGGYFWWSTGGGMQGELAPDAALEQIVTFMDRSEDALAAAENFGGKGVSQKILTLLGLA